MFRPHLVLEHRQQIANHAQALRQQRDPLIHLQITPHGGVDRFEAGFGPHELGTVEHGPLQMDVDPEDEELADLLMDLASRQGDGTGEGDLLRQGLRGCDVGGQAVLEQGCLDALGQSVRDGQLGHVIPLLAQGDEVVVDAGLVLPRVVEVEVLGLDVGGQEGILLESGDVAQELRFLGEGHAPYDDGPVGEEEDLGDMDGGIKVLLGGEGGGIVMVEYFFGGVVGQGRGAVFEGGVAGGGGDVDEVLAALGGVSVELKGAVGETTFPLG